MIWYWNWYGEPWIFTGISTEYWCNYMLDSSTYRAEVYRKITGHHFKQFLHKFTWKKWRQQNYWPIFSPLNYFFYFTLNAFWFNCRYTLTEIITPLNDVPGHLEGQQEVAWISFSVYWLHKSEYEVCTQTFELWGTRNRLHWCGSMNAKAIT